MIKKKVRQCRTRGGSFGDSFYINDGNIVMPSVTPRNINLKEALDQIKNGSIVVPDFQRKFVWDPESVRELLVSIVGNYYIGSLLSIPSSSINPDFAISLIEGVTSVSPSTRYQSQVNIILDGLLPSYFE